MFDIGWMELMVIGIVALVVVGPRDLPEMFRQLGRITAKLRQMGREFSRAMEQAANETGVADVKRDLTKVTQPVSSGMQSLKSAADKFEKWDPVKNAAKPTAPLPQRPLTPPPMPAAAPVAAAAAPDAAAVAAAPEPAAEPAAGPNTAALAEMVAKKRSASAQKAADLKAAKAEPAATPEAAPEAAPAAVKRGGRTRKKADAGEEA